MLDTASGYLAKAEESLAGAESELIGGRYNNCANRSYFACFQAAVYALIRAGIHPPGRTGQWGHDVVQAQFAGQLINRRKLYPAALRSDLVRNYDLRKAADYWGQDVGKTETVRPLQRARGFVSAIRGRVGEPT